MTVIIDNSGDSRKRSTVALRLVGLVLLTGFCVGLAGNRAQAQQLWFAPVTDANALNTDKDYQQLFLPNSPWQHAISKTRVFMLPGNYFGKTSKTNLFRMFAFLKQHNIGVALRLSMLLGNHCGQGIEGYTQNPRENYAIAFNYKKYGADVQYVVADSPLTFGHYATGQNQCHYSMGQVATSIANSLSQVHQFYPQAQLVDTEAVRDVRPSDLGPWLDTLKSAIGGKQFSYHFDVQWYWNWQSVAPGMVKTLQQHGIPYGVQFRGTGAETSDAAWMAEAKRSVQQWEGAVSGSPDQPMIQSWNKNPSHVLPETDPNAMTYMLDWYCANARQPACR